MWGVGCISLFSSLPTSGRTAFSTFQPLHRGVSSEAFKTPLGVYGAGVQKPTPRVLTHGCAPLARCDPSTLGSGVATFGSLGRALRSDLGDGPLPRRSFRGDRAHRARRGEPRAGAQHRRQASARALARTRADSIECLSDEIVFACVESFLEIGSDRFRKIEILSCIEIL